MTSMLWLDKVLAVPKIGLLISPSGALATGLLATMAPLLDEMSAAGEPYDLNQTGPQAFTLRRGDGIHLKANPQNLVVEFYYQRTATRGDGLFPVYSEPKIRTFQETLGDCIGFLHRVLRSISGEQPIQVLRLGIVAATLLDDRSAPPGVVRFIEHLGSPWGARPVLSDLRLLVTMAKDEKWEDRCHHVIKFDDTEEPKQMQFSLDWQRVYATPRPMRPADCRSEIDEAWRSASAYFEDFATGTWKHAR